MMRSIWEYAKKLWKAFREEWNKKLIAGAVALTFVGLAFFARSAINVFKQMSADFRSISKKEALTTSKTYLGNNVLAALPFRNVGDDAQYIAAVTAIDDTSVVLGSGMQAFLLAGNGDKYDVIKLEPQVFDQQRQDHKDLRGLFGLIDLEGDGKKSVFTVYRAGGNAKYTIEVGLYDAAERESYQLSEEGEYGNSGSLAVLSKYVPPNPAVQKWFAEKTKEFIIVRDDPASYEGEAQLWRMSNGDDFTGGLVQIHEFPGRIPLSDAPSIECEVEDTQFQWISFFKGGIFGYDKNRKVHFAVWLPPNRDAFVPELTSGEQYLWFGHDKEDAEFAFDKKEHFLLRDPVSVKETEFSSPCRCKPRQE